MAEPRRFATNWSEVRYLYEAVLGSVIFAFFARLSLATAQKKVKQFTVSVGQESGKQLCNPVTYAVDGLRGLILCSSQLPFALNFLIFTGFAAVMIGIGTWSFKRLK